MISSKLLARKRPRLRPIYDSVVVAVTGTERQHWEPVREAFAVGLSRVVAAWS